MALPFGLTWEELSTALPGVLRARSDECVATRRFAIQGLRDRDASTPLTVRFPIAEGFGTVDLFVKRTPVGAPEAHWYRLLAAHGVPVPALLAELPRENGDVVVVLEFLESVGLNTAATAEVIELLHLLATLNSIVDAEPGSRPAPGGLPEAQFTAMVGDAVATLAGMTEFVDVGIAVPEWLDAYLWTRQSCEKMPKALTHGEMYFQHVGRRRDGTLVLFDLATVGVRPRFSDLCNVVSALADHSGIDEQVLFGRYLDAFAALAGHSPPLESAYRELRLLRVHSAFQALPWLVEAHTNPDIGFAMLAETVATLRCGLADLDELIL